MAALVATTTLAFSSMLLQQGCREQDKCDKAFARLERIAAKRGEPKASESMKSLVMEQCRSEKGTWDPVINCALHAASDDEADACIQAGIKDVLHSNDDEGSSGSASGGKGLNPLLEE
jgi:hypothetical protein